MPPTSAVGAARLDKPLLGRRPAHMSARPAMAGLRLRGRMHVQLPLNTLMATSPFGEWIARSKRQSPSCVNTLPLQNPADDVCVWAPAARVESKALGPESSEDRNHLGSVEAVAVSRDGSCATIAAAAVESTEEVRLELYE
ncbi:hypothetical protein NL676_004436 [Syzygium grande]|nr:hypothetical protein NL676_004436 [Syzygium grande]